MGYYGLLSKACLSCRERRIKCDLSIPACSQCTRALRVCSGYRNPKDYLFHDQSKQVASKVQRTKQASARKAAEDLAKSSGYYCRCSHVASQPNSSTILNDVCLLPHFHSTAIGYQTFRFLFGEGESQPSKSATSLHDITPSLYCSEPPESPLVCMITALGIAALHCHNPDIEVGVSPSAWYGKALQKINRSLQDETRAKADQTLHVVLLCGIYESMTCSTPAAMKSWLNHSIGAAALLELRGEEQLDSELGRALFIQARTQVIAVCYQTRSPIPDIIIRLSEKCHSQSAKPLKDLIPIIFRICNRRAATASQIHSTDSDSSAEATIEGYPSIAQAIAMWYEDIPAGLLSSIASVGLISSMAFPSSISCNHPSNQWDGQIESELPATAIATN